VADASALDEEPGANQKPLILGKKDRPIARSDR